MDRYGRIIGKAYFDGEYINAWMVAEGHAWVYRDYSDDQKMLELEATAYEQGIGLWSLPEAERVPVQRGPLLTCTVRVWRKEDPQPIQSPRNLIRTQRFLIRILQLTAELLARSVMWSIASSIRAHRRETGL
jgi:hypothetical protein